VFHEQLELFSLFPRFRQSVAGFDLFEGLVALSQLLDDGLCRARPDKRFGSWFQAAGISAIASMKSGARTEKRLFH
jgi:hypothetical protein